MGNETSTPISNSTYPASSITSQYCDSADNDKSVIYSGDNTLQHSRSDEISSLIHFAKSNYEIKPDKSLSALMQAMTLNSGPTKASQAMRCIKAELERLETPDSAMVIHQYPNGHYDSGAAQYLSVHGKQDKLERISRIVHDLLGDRSTYLYQMGQQHILQQAMEDGSSIVCAHCKGMIPVKRLQQHEKYWCPASSNSFISDIEENDDEMELS